MDEFKILTWLEKHEKYKSFLDLYENLPHFLSILEDYYEWRQSEEGLPWVDYPKVCPEEYGKYIIQRKDGKMHIETWNGIGWAYNGKSIVKWVNFKLK